MPGQRICASLAPAHIFLFFFFNDTATTEIYTLSLHDALPISHRRHAARDLRRGAGIARGHADEAGKALEGLMSREHVVRSEEHTSELQSRLHLVCRLLLEKKKLHRRSGAAPTLPPYRVPPWRL